VRAIVDHLAAWFRSPPWAAVRVAPPAPRTRLGKRRAVVMTDQDVRRLGAVAAVYEGTDPDGAARLRSAVAAAKATLAAKIPRSTVTMNSRIVLRERSGHEREVSLVYPWDARGDKVSVASALGCALLGTSVGDAVEEGRRAFTVASIPYQPEAAGDHHL
jgi:transcription elongation GreA/GreB family factor